MPPRFLRWPVRPRRGLAASHLAGGNLAGGSLARGNLRSGHLVCGELPGCGVLGRGVPWGVASVGRDDAARGPVGGGSGEGA